MMRCRYAVLLALVGWLMIGCSFPLVAVYCINVSSLNSFLRLAGCHRAVVRVLRRDWSSTCQQQHQR